MIKAIPQTVISGLAFKAAAELHEKTGLLVGHSARYEPHGQRVVFAFKVGTNETTYEVMSLLQLNSLRNFETAQAHLVSATLAKNSTTAIGLKADAVKVGTWAPEIAPFIDSQGRRHFRLQADVGRLTLIGQNLKQNGRIQ